MANHKARPSPGFLIYWMQMLTVLRRSNSIAYYGMEKMRHTCSFGLEVPRRIHSPHRQRQVLFIGSIQGRITFENQLVLGTSIQSGCKVY